MTVSVNINAETRQVTERLNAVRRDFERISKQLGAMMEKAKEFGKIDFSKSAGALAKEFERAQQNAEKLLRQHPGFGRRLEAFGMSGRAPWEWDFSRMHVNPRSALEQQRHILRQVFEGTRWALPEGAGGAGGGGYGGGYGGGGTGGWIKTGLAIGGSVYGIQSVMGAVMEGLRTMKSAETGFDTVFRRMRDAGVSIDDVRHGLQKFASELRMTDDELATHARSYMEASRENRLGSAASGMRTGAGFALSYGMEAGEGVNYFARSRMLGLFGGDRATQVRYALLMGRTIADGMMHGRPGDAFDSMIKLAETVSTKRVSAMSPEEQSAAMALRAATAATGQPGMIGEKYDALVAKMQAAIEHPGGGMGGEFFMQQAMVDAGFGRVGGKPNPFALAAARQNASLFETARPGGPTLIEAIMAEGHRQFGQYGETGEELMLGRVTNLTQAQIHAIKSGIAGAKGVGASSADISRYLGGIDQTSINPTAYRDIFKTIGLAGKPEELKQYAGQYFEAMPQSQKGLSEAQGLKQALEEGNAEAIAKALIKVQSVVGRERTPADSILETEKGIKEALVNLSQQALPHLKTISDYVKTIADFAEKSTPVVEKIAGFLGVEKPVADAPMFEETGGGLVGAYRWAKEKLGGGTVSPPPTPETSAKSLIQKKLAEQRRPLLGEHPSPSPAPDAGPVPGGTLVEKAGAIGAQYGLPPGMLEGVIEQESNWNPKAVSGKGATGLGQLMPGTAKRWGVSDPNDPEQNMRGSAKYLRWLLDRYDGDQDKALAAYNAGEGNVDKYGGIPPFRETQNYVPAVKRRMARYQQAQANSNRPAASPAEPGIPVQDRPKAYPMPARLTGEPIVSIADYEKAAGTGEPSIKDKLEAAKVKMDAAHDKQKGFMSAEERTKLRQDYLAAEAEYKGLLADSTKPGSYTPIDSPGMPKPPAPKNEKPTASVDGSIDVNVIVKDQDGKYRSKTTHKTGVSTGKASGGSSSVEHVDDGGNGSGW